MPELILRFQRIDKDAEFDAPVPVTVQYEGTDVEAFEFINPLTDRDLADIRWYLEQYYYWPSDIDRDRARLVEGNLPKWGKALFDAIFGKSTDAMRLFGRFDDDHGAGRAFTIDTTEPRVLRLPWELLRDEGGYLFAKNPPMTVLRRMHQTRRTEISAFEPPVRILMVTCRPDSVGFIDPRSIATPLLDSLDGIPEQVEVEFLRPPTLRALDVRLRDANQPRVHIVHFDGHGVYDKSVGLGFLLFEDENHQKHQVDAEQLGTLLNESGIPLMVLNACQSAQPDDRNPFASVASRLIESGVGAVVAMNYSVLVETAKRFTSEFYGSLARGLSANATMDSARRSLFSDTKRFTFTRPHQEEAENLHLQDWFLPALYQQAETLTPFKPDGRPASSTNKATIPLQEKGQRGGFPPAPLHGFKGRARELLDLERAFATRDIVVLHGFGGQGKTSLATQAAEWFTRTHLFDRAAFISFETGASLDFVLNELGNALVEENFQIHEGDKVAAIAQSLKEKPTLLVFDNFESVLPNGNAPMQEELQSLLDAASKWFGTSDPRSPTPNSRLLVTTRNTDIPHPSFTPSKTCLHKELEGLAASDALELAASILEAHSLPRPPRVPLEELLKFLKRHPLSLQLALPQLRDYSAEQLIEQYQSILPQMKKGEAKERNESLEVSLRFSLDRLGADALNWLSRLWIFEGGALGSVLLNITEIPEETWNTLKPQLTSTALIRAEEIPGVGQPFIHFHPTLAPYLRAISNNSELDSQTSNIEERYWQGYYQLIIELYQLDTQHPMQARAIVLRELPNLKRALKQTLAAGALDEAVNFAVSINRFLDVFGRWRERDEIAAEVERTVSSNQPSESSDGKITKAQFMMEKGRGERLLQQGRAGEAEKVFRKLLKRLDADVAYDKQESLFDQATILGLLGMCLSNLGYPEEGADCYRRAIALSEGLVQTNELKDNITAHHDLLADTLTAMGHYSEARKEYETALALAKETNNARHQSVFISQLGTLALKQGDLKEARKRYIESLEIDQRNGEQSGVAISWHQLGRVAEEARDWDEAERCYKESMAIKERLGNDEGVASTCNQLAIVAESAGRPQEAERWYLRAIELEAKLGNKDSLLQAHRYSNLAGVYLSQNRLNEAEDYATRACLIIEKYDLSAQPWILYNLLAQINEKRGRMDKVREWRRKEQESRLIFEANSQADTSSPNVRQKADQWNDTVAGIIAVCQSGKPDSELDKFLAEMVGNDALKNLVIVLRRILSGERGIELFDGLDDVDSAILRRALKGVLTDTNSSSSQLPSQDGEQRGVTLPQLLEYVESAANGDTKMGEQLFPDLQKMSRNSDPTISALGNVLLRVLIRDFNPKLDGLSDEVASAVRGMLGRLKNK